MGPEPIIATAESCQNTYYTLYTCLRNTWVTPQVYLREWSETEQCDGFADLSHVREDIAEHIGQVTMRKIKAYQPLTLREGNHVFYYVHGFHKWHKACLWKALSWQNKAYYLSVP